MIEQKNNYISFLIEKHIDNGLIDYIENNLNKKELNKLNLISKRKIRYLENRYKKNHNLISYHLTQSKELTTERHKKLIYDKIFYDYMKKVNYI